MTPRLLVVGVLLTLWGGNVSASTATAENRLQTAIKDVLDIAQGAPSDGALAESIRPVLEKYLSFSAMTRRAVGPGWRQFSKGDQSEATRLFSTLIIRTYSKKLTPGEYPVITFKTAVSPAPGRVDIPTTLLYRGSTYNVTYRMEQDEGWRVTDVVIEGVSLIANYRTQFDAQFKKGGSNAVLASLTQSVAQPK